MLLPKIFHDNFADDFFKDMFTMPFGWDSVFSGPISMNTDVQEYNDKYLLELELPGFSREDICAELREGYLIINANHNENKDEKDKEGNYIRRERYTGQCRRSFYVGNNVNQEEIKANFENGVLKLEIPRKEEKLQVEEKNYIEIEG